MSWALIRPALPSSRIYVSGTGVPVARQKAPPRPTVPGGQPGPVRIANEIVLASRSITGSTQVSLPFFVERANDLTRSIGPSQAGFGDLTVRAQIHAITVASPLPCSGGSATSGYRPPILR